MTPDAGCPEHSVDILEEIVCGTPFATFRCFSAGNAAPVFDTTRRYQSGMPGAGRSNAPLARGIGALVALIAVVGSLAFGWSFNSPAPIPTAIGIFVAAVAIGWTLCNRIA